MLVVGLTGGIATGKSTVSGCFKNAGAIIIDADQIARQVLKKDLPAYHEVIKHFGKEVILPDGEINRGLLADIIFKDPDKKQLLNTIVHPWVRRETNRLLDEIERNNPEAVVVLDVPLLLEADMHKDLSEVIVVYTPEHIQLQRLMARDNISETDAKARISSQMPIENKKALATLVIDNTGTVEKTRKRTLEVYKYLKSKTL